MLCTALGEKDTPEWPFWKWQHMKSTHAVTDIAMIAVTREQSFIATKINGVSQIQSLKPDLKTLDQRLLKSFLDAYYVPNSYLIYGGHGVSDLIEFDPNYRMQVHELAACLGDRQFHGILFDACLMASLDTAYYLRNNTRWVGAAEGYMWEEDTWSEKHMFNPYTAALMSRDANAERVLQLVGEEYTRKSDMADYTLIDTKDAGKLYERVHSHHLPAMNAMIRLRPEVKSGEKEPTLDDQEVDYDASCMPNRAIRSVSVAHPPDFPAERTVKGTLVPRTPDYRHNYEIPFSLYPEETPDNHVVDLGCYLQKDRTAMTLLDSVVAWRDGPRASLYSVPAMHGLNFAFSQYSYQSMRKAVSAEEATELAARFEVAAREAEGLSMTATAIPFSSSAPVRPEVLAAPLATAAFIAAANTPQASIVRPVDVVAAAASLVNARIAAVPVGKAEVAATH
jgi:hypothetical protein